MGTNFTACKKPLEEGWPETQAEPSELLPCAGSLFFLHCPPPRALHTTRMPEFYLIFFYHYTQWVPARYHDEKKLHEHYFEKWGEHFYIGHFTLQNAPTHHRFSPLSLVFAIVVNWVLLSVFAIFVNWVLLSIESRRWFWLLLLNFWPNPKVNSWVLLTFTDNFTIIDNMNRKTWLWKL